MKRLCTSKIMDGEYDSIISMMIKQEFDNHAILREMMTLTKGHENPKTIEHKIETLRDEYEKIT